MPYVPHRAPPPSPLHLLTPVRRWTPGRKAAVVLAVRKGELTLYEVLKAHGLSAEEFHGWDKRHIAHGQRGLANGHIQDLRL
jgi:transposase-like protein